MRPARRFNPICVALLLLMSASSYAQYLGFDRNDYPGDSSLAALHRTFTFSGYWLNNPPGSKSNTWRGKRLLVEKAGFGFLVLFTGKTYAQLKGSEAETMGAADGLAAAEAAKNEGFPAGTTIFLDQEEGGRLLPEQKAYLLAWTDAVSSSPYRAGVYCSGIPATEQSSGESIITAEDIRAAAEDRDIAYFIANDSCPPSPGCVFKAPAIPDSGLKFADVWQYAQSPRRKPQTDSCAQTYSSDGNCYPPDLHIHVDLDVASSADPSHGRTKEANSTTSNSTHE